MGSGSRVATLLLFVPSLGLFAQAPASPPETGTRLRVTLSCEGPTRSTTARECRAKGRLVRWQSDTVVLAGEGSAASYALSSIRGVEVSRGHRSYRLAGAGTGLVLGAGVTYLVLNSGGSTAPCDQDANQDAMSSEECLGLTALGAVAGAGLGFLIGGLFRTERWEEIPLDRLRMGIGPSPGGRLTLALRISF